MPYLHFECSREAQKSIAVPGKPYSTCSTAEIPLLFASLDESSEVAEVLISFGLLHYMRPSF